MRKRQRCRDCGEWLDEHGGCRNCSQGYPEDETEREAEYESRPYEPRPAWAT